MNIDIKSDLWHYLAECNRPIVMYGMGNGADKILAVCESYGIRISDFFASDGFVRGHQFHGKTVISYSAMKERYISENPIVLLSFASSLPDVLELFRMVERELEFYAPDVPVFGSTLFTFDFFEANRERFEYVYNMLADEESKRIYENVIKYKLSGRISYLWDSESDRDEVFERILDCRSIRSCVDAGAYNGDTLRELISYAPELEHAIALEPDARNFKKLALWSESQDAIEVKSYNLGAWSERDTLLFDASGNRNAGIATGESSGQKLKSVDVVSIDSLLDGAGTDYIKYDVEGSEREALIGSSRTIKEYAPRLLVSLYHRSEDMFELPELVLSLQPDYMLYLRRFQYIPAWDLNLYAIKK